MWSFFGIVYPLKSLMLLLVRYSLSYNYRIIINLCACISYYNSCVCIIPVHILHPPLPVVCDIHIHYYYKCLSSVLRVSVSCWFAFDPLRLPQVSHLCYLGWVQVLLSRLDSISVFLILVIFCHGFIIGPFLGTFRFKLFADFWTSSNVVCFFWKSVLLMFLWHLIGVQFLILHLQVPSIFVPHHYLIFCC